MKEHLNRLVYVKLSEDLGRKGKLTKVGKDNIEIQNLYGDIFIIPTDRIQYIKAIEGALNELKGNE